MRRSVVLLSLLATACGARGIARGSGTRGAAAAVSPAAKEPGQLESPKAQWVKHQLVVHEGRFVGDAPPKSRVRLVRVECYRVEPSTTSCKDALGVAPLDPDLAKIEDVERALRRREWLSRLSACFDVKEMAATPASIRAAMEVAAASRFIDADDRDLSFPNELERRDAAQEGLYLVTTVHHTARLRERIRRSCQRSEERDHCDPRTEVSERRVLVTATHGLVLGPHEYRFDFPLSRAMKQELPFGRNEDLYIDWYHRGDSPFPGAPSNREEGERALAMLAGFEPTSETERVGLLVDRAIAAFYARRAPEGASAAATLAALRSTETDAEARAALSDHASTILALEALASGRYALDDPCR